MKEILTSSLRVRRFHHAAAWITSDPSGIFVDPILSANCLGIKGVQ